MISKYLLIAFSCFILVLLAISNYILTYMIIFNQFDQRKLIFLEGCDARRGVKWGSGKYDGIEGIAKIVDL